MIRLFTLPAGFLLDLLMGDPRWLYHPVCLIGKLISVLEKGIRKVIPKSEKGELAGGVLEVILVCLITFLVPFGIIHLLYKWNFWLGFALETFWCGQLLATKSLKVESMKVYDRLKNGTIEEARYAVSMIVGRDTQALSEIGVTKAAVETVAENTSDGVTAPLFYLLLGGVPLGFCYKAINTLDSMVGYRNAKYLFFGRASAKTDDAANWLPARICGVLLTVSAFLLGLDGKGAWWIFRRDRNNHLSPNSAQTESAAAGALGIQLGGTHVYFGEVVEKPTIGNADRPAEPEDIPRTNGMMLAASGLSLLGFGLLRLVVVLLLR